MGHVLHVWEGPRPAGREEAIREFYGLACEHLMDNSTPPTEAMAGFLGDLLEVWPERVTSRGVELRYSSPWKWPARHSVSGPVWRCQAKDERAAVATYVVAAIAERHGLNWHDPQPPASQVSLRPVWESQSAPLFGSVALSA